jgi:uncharacterized protein YkwD
MKSRFFPLFFVGIAAFGLGQVVHSESLVSNSLNLVQFRVALDQIGQGNFDNARVLLENSQGQSASENSLLLAYLQEKAGETEKAWTTLSKIQTRSPLQEAYFTRLSGETNEGQLVLTSTKKGNSAARLSNSDPKVTQLEKSMLAQVNVERAQKGLRALRWDDDAADVARAHSAEMRDKGYFAHESPTKSLESPFDRYKAAHGTSPRLIAENVYRVWGDGNFLTEKAVRDGHTALMKSPGHRSNIMEPEVTQLGIGIVSNQQGHLWITQVFVRP